MTRGEFLGLFHWGFKLIGSFARGRVVQLLILLGSCGITRLRLSFTGFALTGATSIGLGQLVVAVGEETAVPIATLALLPPVLAHFVLKALGWRAIAGTGWRR